jgi:hypothetical protein
VVCHVVRGLRHLAGAELAEARCSRHEIMSIIGHLTEREAAGYVNWRNARGWHSREWRSAPRRVESTGDQPENVSATSSYKPLAQKPTNPLINKGCGGRGWLSTFCEKTIV